MLIIPPLVTIMSEQCEKLENCGFRATYIGKNALENDSIENGLYDFVLGSPETVVGDSKWRDVLKV